jgi:hypothetical protein
MEEEKDREREGGKVGVGTSLVAFSDEMEPGFHVTAEIRHEGKGDGGIVRERERRLTSF